MTQTGPVTPAAKAVVSRNALKHGFAAGDIVIQGLEDTEEWQALRDSIYQSWDPAPGQEDFQCERIAINCWKLRRIERWQAASIQAKIDEIEYEANALVDDVREGVDSGDIDEVELDFLLTPDQIQVKQLLRLVPRAEDLSLIIRYEAHLHRQILQNSHELEALQIKRKGGHSPLARLDITGAPAG